MRPLRRRFGLVPRILPTCHSGFTPQFFLAFLKANFTTEGTQNHGRSCLTDSASKGTSCNERKRRMGLGGEGKIILHQTPYGPCSYINGGIGWDGRVDIAGMPGQRILAAGPKVAVRWNLA